MKLRHVGYVVDDLRSAANYYAWFGFNHCMYSSEVWHIGNKGIPLSICKAINISLPKSETIEFVKGNWWNHTCFEVSKQELKKMLLQSEVLIFKEERTHDVYFVSGYGGQVIELYHKKGE